MTNNNSRKELHHHENSIDHVQNLVIVPGNQGIEQIKPTAGVTLK
jgi:hypothetical protein